MRLEFVTIRLQEVLKTITDDVEPAVVALEIDEEVSKRPRVVATSDHLESTRFEIGDETAEFRRYFLRHDATIARLTS